jgi:hypothetical protein
MVGSGRPYAVKRRNRQSNGGGAKPPNSRSIIPANAIVVRSSRSPPMICTPMRVALDAADATLSKAKGPPRRPLARGLHAARWKMVSGALSVAKLTRKAGPRRLDQSVLALKDVPQPHRAVTARADNSRPVRAERHGMHLTLVAP